MNVLTFSQLALLVVLAALLGYSAGWFSGQRALAQSLLKVLFGRTHSPLAQDLIVALVPLSIDYPTKWQLARAWLYMRLARWR